MFGFRLRGIVSVRGAEPDLKPREAQLGAEVVDSVIEIVSGLVSFGGELAAAVLEPGAL